MNKLDIRLLVRIESGYNFDPYLKLSTEIVYLDGDGQWSTCYGYSTPKPLSGYDRLGIRTSADKYNPQLSVYGCRPEFMDVHKVDLVDARRMAAILNSIGRKLDKLNAEFGHPQTVTDCIVRFAKAVGCTHSQVFGHYDKTSPRQDGQGFVWNDADLLRLRILREQDQFAEKYSIKRQDES